MKKAWADFWERYADRSGKTTWSEYWFMVGAELLIIGFIVSFGPILNWLSSVTSYDFSSVGAAIAPFFLFIWAFLMTFVLPNFSLNVRRFNDVGIPHWLSSLLAFLGYAMAIVALFCQLTGSTGIGFILLMIAGDVLLMLIAALPANTFKHVKIAKI